MEYINLEQIDITHIRYQLKRQYDKKKWRREVQKLPQFELARQIMGSHKAPTVYPKKKKWSLYKGIFRGVNKKTLAYEAPISWNQFEHNTGTGNGVSAKENHSNPTRNKTHLRKFGNRFEKLGF